MTNNTAYSSTQFNHNNMILKLLLYPLIILYGALAIFAYRTAYKTILKYRKIKQIQHDPQWQGLIRKDFNNWNEKQIYRGCLTKFPWKLMSMLLLIGIIMLLIKLGRRKAGFLILWFERFLLERVIKIDDVDCEEKAKTPIVISNHVNWLDIVYLFICLQPLSFVAKKEIQVLPLFGPASKRMQCLLVNRESQVARNEILTQIRKRIQQYSENKQVYPLLIFPEGTTSNGHSILRFKNGAFANLPSITLFALIYECEGFDMGMEQITPIEHIIISLCLSPTLKARSVLMNAVEGQSEEQYKQRCQKKMSELTGFKTYQAGYTQKCLLGAKRKEMKND